MATYAQLQAEPWWYREITPGPLRDLGERLRAHYKRPNVAVGIKGDNSHLNGAHRSQEWIERSGWCTSRTYTVQSGLTGTQKRYLAALDFNPGSEARMVELCSRLDKAVRSGRLEQVREWFGNDDGDNRVDGYDNVRNRIATSDASHLWHLHLTLDRRLVNSPAAMREVGDVLLGIIDLGEDDVSAAEVWDADVIEAPVGSSTRKTNPTWKAGYTLTRIAQEALYDIPSGLSAVRKELAAARKRDEAILAALAGADVGAILTRIEQRSAEDAARDEQAEADRDALAARLDRMDLLLNTLPALLTDELRVAAADLPGEATQAVAGLIDQAVARAMDRVRFTVEPEQSVPSGDGS